MFIEGAKVAQHSCKHLHTRIANQPEFSWFKFRFNSLQKNFIDIFLEQGNIEAAIRKGYIEFDKEMSLDENMREDLAGTTAICVLIKEQKLFCVRNDQCVLFLRNLI